MNVKRFDNNLIVIDDYLTPDEFAAASNYVASRRYPSRLKFFGSNVNSSEIRYAMNSGIYLTAKGRDLVPAISHEAYRRRVLTTLPAGDPVDVVTQRFMKINELIESAIGVVDKEWFGYTRGFFRSKAGANLRWHTDDNVYAGAYVFYSSKNWEIDWGGELCFTCNHKALSDFSSQKKLSAFDGGQFIFPRPNRLVLIPGGVPHRVTPIANLAKLPRYTVSGFFVNNEGLLAQEKALKRHFLSTSWIRRTAVDLGLLALRGKI